MYFKCFVDAGIVSFIPGVLSGMLLSKGVYILDEFSESLKRCS